MCYDKFSLSASRGDIILNLLSTVYEMKHMCEMFSVFTILILCLSMANGGLDVDHMEDSVQDVLEEPRSFSTGRFFNYDRGAAFNTSVAFTIPLFSFTLPGASEATNQGYDGNTFGVMAFVAIFLIGGLGVAIYTTTQGGNSGAEARSSDDGLLLNTVYKALESLPEALSFDSCSKLPVCAVYREPEKYGFFLTWAVKAFNPVDLEKKDSELTEFQAAAKFGLKDGQECYMEYPCLVNPFDMILYFTNFIFSKPFF